MDMLLLAKKPESMTCHTEIAALEAEGWVQDLF